MGNDALARTDPYQPQSLESAEKLANKLALSPLLPKALQGRPGDVLVIMMSGHELGLSPMQALRGMYVINGKVSMYADLAVALVRRSPDCMFFRLVESNEKSAIFETQRKGDPAPTKLSYTMEQAKASNLISNPNYQKHPAAMLRARASMALARVVFPDMLQGIYSPDELEDESEPLAPSFVAPPLPSKVEPEDAQFVDAEPESPVPDGADESEEERALHAIASAETSKDLLKLLKNLPAVSSVRAAYNARNKELRTGATP